MDNKFSPSTNPPTVKKDVKYIKLPYMGPLSFEMRKSLNNVLKNCYPQIKFHFAFKNTYTIGNFLKRKEKRISDLSSGIVYLFNCPVCHDRYIGSTSRWLKHRILEHRGRSVRTGAQLSRPSHSSIRDHSLSTDHPYTATDFSILSFHPNRLDLITAESMHIRQLKPELNGSTTATTLYIQ